MVGRLDKAHLSVGLQKQVVPQAFISGVRRHGVVFSPMLLLQCPEKGDQGSVVCTVGKCVYPCDILAVHRDLHIVPRLELPVPHMVVFHPHECGVRIGFGIAVAAFAHALQLFLIFLPAAAQGIQCLPFLLFCSSLLCLPLP